MTEYHRYSAAELLDFGVAALRHLGMTDEDATTLATNLVDADLHGTESHGIARLEPYIGQMRSGDVNLRPQVTVQERTPVAALVEGDGGFGVIAGMKAMDWAVQRAKTYGIAIAGVRNVGHFGTASYYTRAANREGMLGIAMTDTSPVVAPAGGAEPRLGNNPLSIAAPDGKGGTAFCLDVAMSVVSRGRVKLYSLAGNELPGHWAIDAEGNPTTDAEAALGGALLPFGDYKGSGLSMAVEILAGALTGASLTQQIRHGGFTNAKSSEHAEPDARSVTVGNLYLAVNPSLFRPAEEVVDDVEKIISYVKSSRPRPGATVRIAGEPEAEAYADRSANGIPVSDATLAGLHKVAADAGLELREPR